MKFLNFDKVLCLAPHPDDAEYSIAGTVLRYTSTQFDLLCLTQGGDCDTTTSSSRLKEVVDVWNISKASNYNLLFTTTSLLKDRNVDQWIAYIENDFLKQVAYDCLLVPSEYDSHFEHVIVSSFAAPLSRVYPYSIIQYKSPSTLSTWIPNLFVSIGDQYETKKKMLTKFESQINKPYFSNQVLDGFHTDFQCMKKGKGFVESFKVITSYE
jgi:LmbE family N-acetylglucosaminyl deacetylase